MSTVRALHQSICRDFWLASTCNVAMQCKNSHPPRGGLVRRARPASWSARWRSAFSPPPFTPTLCSAAAPVGVAGLLLAWWHHHGCLTVRRWHAAFCAAHLTACCLRSNVGALWSHSVVRFCALNPPRQCYQPEPPYRDSKRHLRDERVKGHAAEGWEVNCPKPPHHIASLRWLFAVVVGSDWSLWSP